MWYSIRAVAKDRVLGDSEVCDAQTDRQTDKQTITSVTRRKVRAWLLGVLGVLSVGFGGILSLASVSPMVLALDRELSPDTSWASGGPTIRVVNLSTRPIVATTVSSCCSMAGSTVRRVPALSFEDIEVDLDWSKSGKDRKAVSIPVHLTGRSLAETRIVRFPVRAVATLAAEGRS